MPKITIDEAIKDIKQGRMVILVDDEYFEMGRNFFKQIMYPFGIATMKLQFADGSFQLQ